MNYKHFPHLYYYPNDDLSLLNKAWQEPFIRGLVSFLFIVIVILFCLVCRAEEIDLPQEEIRVITEVADKYKLVGNSRLLLFVIRKVENGRPGREFGVLHPRAINTNFRNQCEWAAGTISKRFSGNLRLFALRWCPPSVHPLNKNWLRNAEFYMTKWKL
jgi:hypothetical protein